MSIGISVYGYSQETEEQINIRIDSANALYHSNPDSSYSLLLLANEKAKVSNNSSAIANTELYIGRYFLLKGELESSEEFLNTALRKFTELNNYSKQGYIYKLKAIILGRIGNVKDEEDALIKSKMLFEQANDTFGLIGALQNMTNFYIENGTPEEAKNSLEVFSSYQNYFDEGLWYYYYQNWGIYYASIKNTERALEHYKKADELAEKLGMTDSKCTILMEVGKLYLGLGIHPLAKKYLHESETLAIKNSLNHELEETLSELINLYQKEKDFEKAFKYLKQQNVLRKSMYDLEKVNNINTYEKKLQLAEKEKIIAQKELDIEKGNLLTEKAEYKNRLFLSIIGFVLLLTLFSLFMYLKTRKLNSEIGKQKKIIEEKNILVEESLKSVTDSINYSRRLQEAIMPGLLKIEKHLPPFFVTFLPKDIVAGDFYWFELKGDKVFIAAADCTGHGVPGAMVSVVCSNALNRAVREFGITQPGKILDKAKEIVEETFHVSDSNVKDGMDISLCAIDLNSNKMEWAGANNPLWIFRKETGKIEVFTPDKQPVGISDSKELFHTKECSFQKGDVIYLFTDGIIDQFGGEKGKKLKSSQLNVWLTELSLLPFQNRKSELETRFQNWRQNLEQVDDVCLISVQF